MRLDRRQWSPCHASSVLAICLAASPALAQSVISWSQGPIGRASQVASDGSSLSARVLAYSPTELERALEKSSFALPKPDGSLVEFALVAQPTLSPELQAARPELRTYAGVSADVSGLPLRMTVADGQILASVLGPDGWTLDSTLATVEGQVLAWNNADDPSSGVARCEVDADPGFEGGFASKVDTRAHGSQLRTYEYAMTGTGEFTQFHGGTTNASSQITQLVNVVNFTLERDLAVRLILVDINLYTDPLTDPFSNGSFPDGTTLAENQAALDAKLGIGGYELGHVVSQYGVAGWRGLAQVGVQCNNFGKARGATFAGSPTSSTLAEGILHEGGHQLGASHSYNGTDGSCGANRVPSWAYEIGSGVTSMSYAGTCASENVVTTRIGMYGAGSLDAIVAKILSVPGCGSTTSTGNTPPVAEAGPSYTIPRGTAFVLDGSASSDADGNSLTYSWEQHDLGTASPPYGPATGPLFRNFAPSSSAKRSVPSYPAYRNNGAAPWEFLPTVDRLLTFRLVVRDNVAGGAGIAWDTMTLTVSGEQFRILSPNGTENIEAGSQLPVSWQVGGGSVAANVRILWSIDRGDSWTEIEPSTPNDGSHTISVPCDLTSEARIRIEPTDNIFFDISDDDFTITPDATAPSVVCPGPFSVEATGPEGIALNDPALATWLGSAVISDGCDPSPNVSYGAPATIPIGTTSVAWLVTDDDGNFNFCTADLTVTEPTASPTPGLRTRLVAVRPNPFNPATTVVFDLSRAQNVSLEIYDLRGRRVASVFGGQLDAGPHEIRWRADGQPSGVYLARLLTEEGSFESRVALVK